MCDNIDSNDCHILNIDLSIGANLVSFSSLPENRSLSAIFSNIENNISVIIGEGEGAINLNGIWYGSLYQIEPENGYWLVMEHSETLIIEEAIPIAFNNNNIYYELHTGNNLLSYPFNVKQSIEEAISEE